MIKKNDERISVVSAMGANGEGLVKEEGCVIFLPFAFLGEKIRYKVLQVKKNIAFGKVLEVLTPARERVKPVCPLFTKCGGCQLQHLKYSEQLKLKRDIVADCLTRIGKIDAEVLATVPAENEYGYRNKLQIPVVWQNGETVIGFYAENSHRAVRTERCAIQPEWAEKIISVFNEYIKNYKLKGYDEEKHSGDLRHIAARGIDGKFIVTAVALRKDLPGIGELAKMLQEKLGEVSLYVNVNDKRTNVVFGDAFFLICGPGRYTIDGEIKYEFGAESFLQVNTEMSRKLYKKAVELASPDKECAVIDAFSGAGLLTAMLSLKAQKAYGVEILPEAVRCADSLARMNKLTEKMENICGKCEEILPDLIPELKRKYKGVTVVLDPPRKGVDYAVLAALKKSCIDRIVYISCNPATLARDIGLLAGTLEMTEKGLIKSIQPAEYEVTYARPFDMFPQTKHVETLVLLSRQTPDDYLEVNVELDDDFLTKAESKGTYDQIKQYIFEKYKLKVSNLYIAQVEDSCGIKERANYNHPKKANSKQPQVPEDKRKIILEALKVFKMI